MPLSVLLFTVELKFFLQISKKLNLEFFHEKFQLSKRNVAPIPHKFLNKKCVQFFMVHVFFPTALIHFEKPSDFRF